MILDIKGWKNQGRIRTNDEIIYQQFISRLTPISFQLPLEAKRRDAIEPKAHSFSSSGFSTTISSRNQLQ